MYALIMAGGSGTRFWPRSRKKHPKQLLKIHGESTMIQQTVERLKPIIPAEKIFIVSTKVQISAIADQLPEIPSQNLIVEPQGKNTAPCIGLGALHIDEAEQDAVMVVLPADHLVGDEDSFLQRLQQGAEIAGKTSALVTWGVKPTYPATGYGYIQHTDEAVTSENGAAAYKVKTFAEKPTLGTAKRFLESGDFLWNSGIFIWKTSVILSEIEKLLPDMYDGLNTIRTAFGEEDEAATLERVYRQIKSISIDYGVMEYAKNVMVLPGDFGWNDLGSWEEVYKIQAKDDDGNVAGERDILVDTKNSFFSAESGGKTIAAIGLDDFIVVDMDDALLICPRDRVQDVKRVVDILKRRKAEELL